MASLNSPKVGLVDGVPESEVGSQLSQLYDAITHLTDRVITLGQRLDPVLTPQLAGSTSDDKAAPEQSLSQVAEHVRNERYRVRSLIDRVSGLLDSLAV